MRIHSFTGYCSLIMLEVEYMILDNVKDLTFDDVFLSCCSVTYSGNYLIIKIVVE